MQEKCERVAWVVWVGAREAAHLRLDLLLDLLGANKRCVSACRVARVRDGFKWHAGRHRQDRLAASGTHKRVRARFATGALGVRVELLLTRGPR